MLMMLYVHRYTRDRVLSSIMVHLLLLLLLLLHSIHIVHDHLLRVRLNFLLVHRLLGWV